MHDAQLHVGANVYVTERFARNRIAPVQDINSKKAAIFRLLLEQNVAMLTTSEKKDLVQTAQQEGMPEVLAVLREFFPGIPEGAGAVHLDMPAYSCGYCHCTDGAQFAYGQIGNVEIPVGIVRALLSLICIHIDNITLTDYVKAVVGIHYRQLPDNATSIPSSVFSPPDSSGEDAYSDVSSNDSIYEDCCETYEEL